MFTKAPSQTKFLIFQFFLTDEVVSVDKTILPKGVENKFKKIRMAYYQDKTTNPCF